MGMKAMYDLRDMLCKELDEITRKGELGAGDLDIAYKLVGTVKNIDKIEMMEDDGGYSRRYSRDGNGRPICGAIMAATAPMRGGVRITSEVITAETAEKII